MFMRAKLMKNSKEYQSKTNISYNFAYITDINYVIPTMTSVYSLIQSLNKKGKYKIYIFYSNLNALLINKFYTLAKYNISIVMIDINNILSRLDNFSKTPKNVTKTALIKFFIADLINEDIVLYLDSDTIILSDITEIFSIDINGFYIGACRDIPYVYYKTKTINGIDFGYDYFNSGVMLMNLDLIRKNRISDTLLKVKKEIKSKLMDQDVFNYVFYNKTIFIGIEFNTLIDSIYRHILKNRISIESLNKIASKDFASIPDIIQNAKIIHFGSYYKPWIYYDVLMSDTWYQFYKNSPAIFITISRKSRLKEYYDKIFQNQYDCLIKIFNNLRKEKIDIKYFKLIMNEFLKFFPKWSEIYSQLSYIHDEKNELNEAIELSTKALELSNNISNEKEKRLLHLAYLYRKIKNYDKAETLLCKCQSINKFNKEMLNQFSLLYKEINDNDKHILYNNLMINLN